MSVAGRSRGSVEFKFQNISAVLHDRDLPFIDGYKPSGNFQTMLAEAVDRRLAIGFENLISAREVAPPRFPPEIVPPPRASNIQPRQVADGAPRRIDWAAVENGRRGLGRVGEAYAIDFEKDRLIAAGRPDLAEGVVWVAAEIGDGAGYDIQSYSDQGDVLYIEVKMTIGGIGTPFFLTENEIGVSQTLKDRYRLYRLFDFAKAPKLYILSGDLSCSCSLTPASYSAVPAAQAR